MEEGNPIFRGAKCEPPEITMYGLLLKLEVEEAALLPVPAEPSYVEGKLDKPKKKKRQPIIPGASLSTDISLGELKRDYNFSEEVDLLVPKSNQRIDNPPDGYFTCVESHFRDSLLWFPVPSIIWKFLYNYEIYLSQLPPGSIRHLVCILVRSYECDVSIKLSNLMKLLKVRKDKGELSCSIQSGYGCRVLEESNFRDRHWDKYFFVRIDSSSVEGPLNLVRIHWSEKANPKCHPPSFDFRAKYNLLCLHRVNWDEHFDLERVENARAIAEGIMSNDESPGLSPETQLLFVKPDVLHDQQRAIEARKTKAAEIMKDSRGLPPRIPEASFLIREPSSTTAPPKHTPLSKAASKRPIGEVDKKDRRAKKAKTSEITPSSSDAVPSMIQPSEKVSDLGNLPS